MTAAAADLRTTLASIDRLSVALNADDGSFNQLLVQLRSAAARAQAVLDEAKVGATTTSLRETSGSLNHAIGEVSDVRDELRASLVSLREALESIRTLADSLERDPSTLEGALSDAVEETLRLVEAALLRSSELARGDDAIQVKALGDSDREG